MSLQIDNITGLLGKAKKAVSAVGIEIGTFAKENPIITGISLIAPIAGGYAISRITKRKKKTTTKRRKKRKTSKGRSRDRKFISKQKHEVAYQKRRKKLGKKTYGKKYKTRKGKKRVGTIYHTRAGQPYKIMSSGKARFIKKTKRRKG